MPRVSSSKAAAAAAALRVGFFGVGICSVNSCRSRWLRFKMFLITNGCGNGRLERELFQVKSF